MTEKTDHGIYVAFDGDGRHFAYALHPDDVADMEGVKDPDAERKQQARGVEDYRRQAEAKGGKLELLSREEYKRRVIDDRQEPETMEGK